jgi:RNA-splicing ligase RtcB
MSPNSNANNVLSWATDLDEKTIAQAEAAASLPFIDGHVALMPDAHLGYGSTIGSVIPTRGAIIPSAIGVDIGCGMIAVETVLSSTDLPDDLGALHDAIERSVPVGNGRGGEHWPVAGRHRDPRPAIGSGRAT